MPKVSVIIPVYNVEQYLEKCLDSVINQTYKNLEIICVNDCSPDNSAQILEVHAKKDERIKIIHRKKNGGLSAARNSGLDNATGNYVCFLDSDDIIELNYIEQMVHTILETKTDFVVNLSMRIMDTTTSNTSDFYLKLSDNGYLDPKKVLDFSPWSACISLYDRNFLLKNDLRFPEGYIHEDYYFHYFVYLKSNLCYVFKGPYYYYRKNLNGISKSKNDYSLTELAMYKLIHHALTPEIIKEYHIRIFHHPQKIFSETVYNLYKIFICEVRQDILLGYDRYEDITLFVIYILLTTSDYTDFISRYPHKCILFLYLRYKNLFETSYKKELLTILNINHTL